MKKIIMLLFAVVGSVCMAASITSTSADQVDSTSVCSISVVDQDGSEIEDVLIYVNNSTTSSGKTDSNGEATITCEENAVLSFSHDWYHSTEVSRNGASELTVVMTSTGNNQK